MSGGMPCGESGDEDSVVSRWCSGVSGCVGHHEQYT